MGFAAWLAMHRSRVWRKRYRVSVEGWINEQGGKFPAFCFLEVT
jgi:hypothetical protein